MPMTWCEPDLFLERSGYRIYRAYKDNNHNHVLRFHYNTDPTESDDTFTFDIRDLGIGTAIDLRDDLGHKCILRTAIDKGLIRFPEEDDD